MIKYIPAFFLALLLMNTLSFAQPPFQDDLEDDDCIEMRGDMPMGPPDFDTPGFKGKKPPKLTEERIAKIMETIETAHPEFHKKIIFLKESHPKVFERTLHKLRRFVRNEKKGSEDRQKLIDIFNDQIELDLLLEKYSELKISKEKDKIKSEMLKKMTENFEKKEQMKLEVIKNIEKNLEEKKKEREKRLAEKDKIIREDLEKMIKFHEKMEEKNR